MNYNSENDLENPTGSVFCSHGAGFHVSWDKVDEYAHIDTGWVKAKKKNTEEVPRTSFSQIRLDEQELEEIFTRTYGPIKRERNGFQKTSRTVTAKAGESSKH